MEIPQSSSEKQSSLPEKQNSRLEFITNNAASQLLDEVQKYYAQVESHKKELKELAEKVDLKRHKEWLEAEKKHFGLDSSATILDINQAEHEQKLAIKRVEFGLPATASEEQIEYFAEGQYLKNERQLLSLPADLPDQFVFAQTERQERLKQLQNISNIFDRAQVLYPKLGPKNAWLSYEYAQKHINSSKEVNFIDLEKAEQEDFQKEASKILGVKEQELEQKRSDLNFLSLKIDYNLPDNASIQDLTGSIMAAEQKQIDHPYNIAKIRQEKHLAENTSAQEVESIKKAWENLENQYGVQIIPTSTTHKQVYALSPNVKLEKLLFEIDCPNSQLTMVEMKIKDYLKDQILNLQNKFHIRIAPENEHFQIKIGNVSTRSPRANELIGLEAALIKNEPCLFAQNQPNDLQFYFLDHYPNNQISGYHTEDSEKGAIYLNLNAHLIASTESELTSMGLYDQEPNSAEAVANHELAHRSQQQDQWKHGTTYLQELAHLGWSNYRSGNGEPDTDWKLKGKDNYYYVCNPIKFTWFRLNESGQPVDIDGKPAKSVSEAFTIDNPQMMSLAVKSPLTPYRPNPVEEDAELLSLYRLGETWRSRLYNFDAMIYDMIKNRDQAEINQKFGINTDGSPKYLRDPSGLIKPNTVSEREIIERFEKQVYKQPGN